MISNPLVSVIIPTYNRSELLNKTILSIIKQTYRPIELIIVDDGSTDDTTKVVEEFENEKYSGIKFLYIKQQNKGAPAARNVGLKVASGEFIQFLDSDDFLKEDKFEKKIKVFTENSFDIVTCDYEKEYSDNQIEYFSNTKPYRKVITGGSLSIFTPLIKAELAKKVTWDEQLHRNQDVDYIQKLFLLTNRIHHIEKSFCIYVQHDKGRIRDIYEKRANTYLKRAKNAYLFYLKNSSLIDRIVFHELILLMCSLLFKDLKSKSKFVFKKIVGNAQ